MTTDNEPIPMALDERWLEGYREGRSYALSDMAGRIRENCIDKGWRGPNGEALITFGEAMALLHSEVSEALEAYRDHGLEDFTTGYTEVNGGTGGVPEVVSLPKPEGVGAELADVLIRLLDTCDAWGIDLQAEVDRKLAYNETRSFRHGNKLL